MILTSYFVYQNNINLKQQEIAFHTNSSEQIVKNLDQRIWSLNKYADTLFFDDHFSDYIITDKDYYIITKVYDKLRADMAVFTDMGGARIAVSKVDDDLVISNQSTRTLEMFF